MKRRAFLSVVGATLASGMILPARLSAAPVSPAEVDTSALTLVRNKHLSTEIAKWLQDYYLATVVYEVNDDLTRKTLVIGASEYMQHLMERRAIQDFTVVCDNTNNPPEMLETGYPGFDVMWKNVKAITYGHFSVGLKDAVRTPTTFEEVIKLQ